MLDCDVLVVGGGPVGETLLTLLGHRGVHAVALERDPVLWPKPRAVHFDGETLRTFQSVGLGDAVARACSPMLSYRMENEAGEVLLDIPTGRLGDQGWHDDYMFHQPDVDALLRTEIDRLPSVRLESGQEVLAITQDADAVTCRVRSADGTEREVRSRYLVGCDGASSSVRRVIGAAWESLGSNDPWLIADGFHPEQAPVEGSMVFFAHHSRPKIWAAMPGNRGRMEFKIMPGDDVTAITSAESIAALTGGMLSSDTFALDRTSVYTFRSCLADRWRDGRVFLAGDAAHLAPPLFGQGLCAGIRDAANLAWKLDLVLAGADEQLLESYESERRPHARSWVVQSTNMSTTIQTTDPDVAAGRDEFLRAHPEQGGVPPAPPLGPGLHGESGAVVGHRSVQPTVAGPGRFDDLVAGRILLAAREDLLHTLPPDLREALAARPDRVLVLTASDPGVDELLAAAGSAAVVVRPDTYVLGVAQEAGQLEQLARRVLGLLAPVAATSELSPATS